MRVWIVFGALTTFSLQSHSGWAEENFPQSFQNQARNDKYSACLRDSSSRKNFRRCLWHLGRRSQKGKRGTSKLSTKKFNACMSLEGEQNKMNCFRTVVDSPGGLSLKSIKKCGSAGKEAAKSCLYVASRYSADEMDKFNQCLENPKKHFQDKQFQRLLNKYGGHHEGRKIRGFQGYIDELKKELSQVSTEVKQAQRYNNRRKEARKHNRSADAHNSKIERRKQVRQGIDRLRGSQNSAVSWLAFFASKVERANQLIKNIGTLRSVDTTIPEKIELLPIDHTATDIAPERIAALIKRAKRINGLIPKINRMVEAKSKTPDGIGADKKSQTAKCFSDLRADYQASVGSGLEGVTVVSDKPATR